MALTVGCALVALAGCGSSASPSAGGTSSSSASAGTPVEGGNLVFANPQDAESLDESTIFDNNSIWIIEQITQPLFTVTNNGKGVMPWLATGYTESKNGLAYTISLRKGVKFSDGTPMTSKDVQFSLEQTMAASQGWGYIDSAIKSVAAPSADTVVVNLKYKWAPILADLALFANGVVPDNYGGKTAAAFYNAPIGTGPFKFDYWHKGSALKLVKNTDYWQPGKPYLDSVTWTDVPDDNTRQLQVTSGQAQIDQFPAWSTVSTLKSTPGVALSLFPSTETNYLAFNEKVKPFQDVNVRRAISYAIDRSALVKAVLFGNGQAANSIFPPQLNYYDANSGGLQYNLADAKAAHGQVQRAEGVHHHAAAALGQLRLRHDRHDRAVRAQAARHQRADPATGPQHRERELPERQVRHVVLAVDDGHPRSRRARHLRARPDGGLEVVLHLLRQPDRGEGGPRGRGDDGYRGASDATTTPPRRWPRRTPSWRSCTTRRTRTWSRRTCTASS